MKYYDCHKGTEIFCRADLPSHYLYKTCLSNHHLPSEVGKDHNQQINIRFSLTLNNMLS